jgi:hypothetical protein
MPLFWVSFAEDPPPDGRGFLGAVILRAKSFLDIIPVTHMLGINPGGEVLGAEFERHISAHYCNRLLDRDEALALDELVSAAITRALP